MTEIILYFSTWSIKHTACFYFFGLFSVKGAQLCKSFCYFIGKTRQQIEREIMCLKLKKKKKISEKTLKAYCTFYWDCACKQNTIATFNSFWSGYIYFLNYQQTEIDGKC